MLKDQDIREPLFDFFDEKFLVKQINHYNLDLS